MYPWLQRKISVILQEIHRSFYDRYIEYRSFYDRYIRHSMTDICQLSRNYTGSVHRYIEHRYLFHYRSVNNQTCICQSSRIYRQYPQMLWPQICIPLQISLSQINYIMTNTFTDKTLTDIIKRNKVPCPMRDSNPRPWD